MSKGFDIKDYALHETGAEFSVSDPAVQYVFDRCEQLCRENIQRFGDRWVLKEGAKYNGVWLETQPMGGEMYASRNMEVALNNHLIFMNNQRRDGRVPGMIRYAPPWMGVTMHYDWFQGDFFTVSAMRMYYLIGKDKGYLRRLYDFLRDFDDYLWKYRDSDGDGCLEAWCIWDTAEDNSTELTANGVHATENGAWCGETPPTDHGKMPYESAAYMAYSYSHLITLHRISVILENGEEEEWLNKAERVRERAIEYLWDNEKKAFYDRDRNDERIDCFTQKNIKCMYHGLFTQEMADEFIALHLLNPDEFNTYLPLPSIAANDPLFYLTKERNNLSPEVYETVRRYMGGDMLDNSWSGPCEGLTYQRSIDALLRYGHHAEMTDFGRRFIENLYREKRFVQQYDPFTGKASPGDDGYGPTMLAALEYITHLYGVDYACDRLTWSSLGDGSESVFSQKLFGDIYTLKRSKDGCSVAEKNGQRLFSFSAGIRIVTDMSGEVIWVYGAENRTLNAALFTARGRYSFTAEPNCRYALSDDGIRLAERVRCDMV